MSTPTRQDDRHEIIEVKPDYDEDEGVVVSVHICEGRYYASEEFCPIHGEKTQDLMERKPWWYWFRIDVPKKPGQRADFIALLLAVLVTEAIIGPIIGMALRSILGWPF